MALYLVFPYTYSQEKGGKRPGTIKIHVVVENSNGLSDTTVYKFSEKNERLVDNSHEFEHIEIRRGGDTIKEWKPRINREFIESQIEEVDSLIIQVIDKMREVKGKIKDTEEYQKAIDELNYFLEKSQTEFDSLRIRIKQSKDDFIPRQVHFYKGNGGERREVVIVKDQKIDEKKVVIEKTPKTKTVNIEKEVGKKPGDEERRVVIMQRGSGNRIVEINDLKIILNNGDFELIENSEKGEYQIITSDGKKFRIIVSEQSKRGADARQNNKGKIRR